MSSACAGPSHAEKKVNPRAVVASMAGTDFSHPSALLGDSVLTPSSLSHCLLEHMTQLGRQFESPDFNLVLSFFNSPRAPILSIACRPGHKLLAGRRMKYQCNDLKEVRVNFHPHVMLPSLSSMLELPPLEIHSLAAW